MTTIKAVLKTDWRMILFNLLENISHSALNQENNQPSDYSGQIASGYGIARQFPKSDGI